MIRPSLRPAAHALVILLFSNVGARLARADCPGDLNQDGRTDLVDLATMLGFFGCAICVEGDVDGDGDTDLADLSRLLSNFGCVGCSSGQLFEMHLPVPASAPTDLAIADLDSDGDRDIAFCGSGSSPLIGILMNQGGGVFEPRGTPLISISPWGVALGMLNNDGIPDIVGSIYELGQVQVAFGTGNGSFSQITLVPHLPAGEGASHLFVANVDGASRPDIVINALSGVRIRWNDGQGGFAPEHNTRLNVSQVNAVAAGALGGDSLLEVIAGTALGDLHVFHQTSPQVFATPMTHSMGGSVNGIAVAALDGDVFNDVVVSVGGQDHVRVMWGTPQPGGLVMGPVLEAGQDILAVVTGDFDADGRPDIAASCRAGRQVFVWRNLGDRQFASPEIYELGQQLFDLVATDISGDGVPDLVVSAPQAGVIRILTACGP